MSVAAIEAAIDQHGQTVKLRRITGVTRQAFFDVTCKAVVRNFQPAELQGEVIQGDREARMSNREIDARQWPGPPAKGDKFYLDGKWINIESVETRRLGEDVALHLLRLRG